MKKWFANIFRPSPRRTSKTPWRSLWLHFRKRGCKTVATAKQPDASSNRIRKGIAVRFMRVVVLGVQGFAPEYYPGRKEQRSDVKRRIEAVQPAHTPRQWCLIKC